MTTHLNQRYLYISYYTAIDTYFDYTGIVPTKECTEVSVICCRMTSDSDASGNNSDIKDQERNREIPEGEIEDEGVEKLEISLLDYSQARLPHNISIPEMPENVSYGDDSTCLETLANAVEEFLKLVRVRQYWHNCELELLYYQDKCKLIKRWDELFNKVKEHINSLAIMKLSPDYEVLIPY